MFFLLLVLTVLLLDDLLTSLLSLFYFSANLTVLSTFLGVFAAFKVIIGGCFRILVNFLYVFLTSFYNLFLPFHSFDCLVFFQASCES